MAHFLLGTSFGTNMYAGGEMVKENQVQDCENT